MALTPPQNQTIGDEDEGDLINMTKVDALRYLKIVKIAFANKVGKYATFRQLLIDFNNGRIELDTLILKAKELLQGHKKLIIGFNTFLPEEIKIKVEDLPDEEADYYEDKVNQMMMQFLKKNLEEAQEMALIPPQNQTIGDDEDEDEDEGDLINRIKEDVLRYLKIVKIAFANKVGKYATFRQLLIDYNNGRIELDTMILKAKELLQGHKKLIIGFNTFLPEEIKIKVEDLPDEEADYYEDKVNQMMMQFLKINLEEAQEACMSI